MKRALVTGGAGLIGSHVADLLVREGWRVRILDNLEPNTHKRGRPAWINRDAEFVQGDVRDRATIENALFGTDIVFHQAAYGGYMPEMAKYVEVNSLGTAQMLEVIREKNFPIKKVIVASSQAVYSEGAGECPKHGLVFPRVRPVEQLQRGDWSVRCPICNEPTRSVPTPEHAPVGGETVYGLTKVDQVSGTDTIRAVGYVPQVDLREGLDRYLDWIRSQSDVRDYFSEAAENLRNKGIVHRVGIS
ncbi:MAG: SDR family NAD(P)-dependent oxidoreductase [Verrucomicrobia bacterium]|nr:MAG: SDR family NAD(P)-dependent oxidoreductase [Verrucomicrobiota bacterium]